MFRDPLNQNTKLPRYLADIEEDENDGFNAVETYIKEIDVAEGTNKLVIITMAPIKIDTKSVLGGDVSRSKSR